MKYLNKYSKFNEGKVSQFLMKSFFKTISFIGNIANRIKGNYIPLNFKDKKVEKRIDENSIKLMDYSIFDTLKYHVSKKYRESISTSFTGLVKERTGIDLYELSDSILNDLKYENIKFSDKPEIKEKQEAKLKNIVDSINRIKSNFKQLDDSILEDKELDRQLKELADAFKALDPSNPENLRRSTEDTLGVFDKVGKKLDKITSKKDLNDIYDKINQWGIDSLTQKEKSDLEKYSKNESVEEFDINFAMSKIKEKFSEEEVIGMYDEELLEWVDSSWEEDGYDSEYDWYVDHNNGEAQDVVITQIIKWYEKEYNKDLSIDDHSELFDEIKSEYGI